jgi:hypothetical protein
VLTLQDASEQAAAVAVLAALYGAKPLPELLSELSQEQQLQAAMLADMWQLPAISAQAAAALAQTLSAQGKLSDAATKQLFSLTAVPDCLQQLLKKVLLSVLGNLEQCWANETLLDMLFSLPLSSMEVLLACSELKVPMLHATTDSFSSPGCWCPTDWMNDAQYRGVCTFDHVALLFCLEE